jgi:hypothetical protein
MRQSRPQGARDGRSQSHKLATVICCPPPRRNNHPGCSQQKDTSQCATTVCTMWRTDQQRLETS